MRNNQFSHSPEDYHCIFCNILQTVPDPLLEISESDILMLGERASAILALGRWPKNPCDVLILPTQHFENLYTLPDDYAEDLHKLTRIAALALKELYRCDGISTRQHNEPAGGQDVWHYHVHVTPRFVGDNFYRSDHIPFPPDDRMATAQQLRCLMSSE